MKTVLAYAHNRWSVLTGVVVQKLSLLMLAVLRLLGCCVALLSAAIQASRWDLGHGMGCGDMTVTGCT